MNQASPQIDLQALCQALPTPMEQSALFHILQGNLAPQSRQLLLRAVSAYVQSTATEHHTGLGDK